MGKMDHSSISFDRLEYFILIETLIFCFCQSFLKTVPTCRNFIVTRFFPFLEICHNDIIFFKTAGITGPNFTRAKPVIAALNGYFCIRSKA